MHSISKTGEQFLRWAVDIRDGETTKTLLMSLFFFLAIFAITVVKPVRNSLFLHDLGAAKLPYMYLATAAFTGILVLIDSKLSSVLNRLAFMSSTLVFLLLNLVAFWWLVKLPEKWVTPTFYIWIGFFNYLLVAHFWTFANDFFNPREAKRLFGVILTAGTFGGIAGGLTADFSVESIFSTEDVLLFAAAALLLSIGVVRLIEKHIPHRAASRNFPKLLKQREAEPTGGHENNFNKRHLTLLATMIVLAVIVSTLIDYQFNFLVEKSYPTKMAKTEFFGEFFALLNVISLLMQFFLTGRILRKFGIGVTLLLMPLLLLVGSASFAIFPTIWLVSILKISDKTLGYSLMQSARELLFLPIPSIIRVKAKLLIDVFINRFAGAIAACLIIFFSLVVPLTIAQLSLVATIFLVGWFATTIALRKEYIKSIKKLLIRRDVDVEERVIATLDAVTVNTLVQSLDSKDPLKVRYALSLLARVPVDEIKEHLIPLTKHWDAAVRAQSLRILFDSGNDKMVRDIMALLSDDNISVRTEAIHFVWAYCQACPDDRISGFLNDPDPKIRGAMLASMVNHTGKLTEEGLVVLNTMLQARSENGDANRTEAARVLGIIDHRRELHEHLTTLLNDTSIEVRKAAIESAGKVRDVKLVASLIEMLGNPRLRKWVRSALANYKNRVLPALAKTLADGEKSLQIKKNIPRLLYQIRTEESWEELFDILDHPDVTIRYAAIKSLNKIRKRWPDWHFDKRKIQDALMEEIQNYYWKFNIFFVYARKEKLSIDVREVDDILYLALTEKLDETLDRIFRLLALLYSQQDIHNSYYYLTRGDKDEKANALEFLDNLLPNDLIVPLLPILDDIPLNHKIRQARALFNLKKMTRKNALLALLEERDLWLEVCAVYSLHREKITDFNHEVKKRLNSNEALLREMAERYFKTFSLQKEVVNDYPN